MRLRVITILLVLLLAAVSSTGAQTNPVTVPDVSGMKVPLAAAELNRAGLNIGSVTPFEGETGFGPDTVVTQDATAGSILEYGSSVNLSVVLPANARLVYDDNDITLINLTDQPLNIEGLRFVTTEGTQAAYNAADITPSLGAGDCWQFWSISRSGPKVVPGCSSIQWRTTNNSNNHFWPQTNGVQRFAVQQDGIDRASCPAAPPSSQNAPLSCEFYLSGGAAGEVVASYVYFAYTPDAVAIINVSDESWMLTDQSTIYNYNPAIETAGAPLIFGDPNLLRDEFRVSLGDITRLAPGQCIMLSTGDAAATDPPEDCDVIAGRTLVSDVAFWLAPFEVESSTIGQRHNCPAATPGSLTRCIMPR